MLSLCPHLGGGGGQVQPGGVSHRGGVRSSWGGVSHRGGSGPGGGGSATGGVRSSWGGSATRGGQVQLGGSSTRGVRSRQGGGQPLGGFRSSWGGGQPRQDNIGSTCYMAGGMPLAFTQEDFLVQMKFKTKTSKPLKLKVYNKLKLFCPIRRFLVHSDTEHRPIESPVSHLCRI